MRHKALTKPATLLAAIACTLAACGTTPEQEREAIERELLSVSEGAELFEVVKEEYPEDIEALVDQVQALSMTERNGQRGAEVGASWVQEFLTRIAPDAVKSPAAEMLVWSATEAELYQTLQRSAETECASMTLGEWVTIEDDNTAARAAIQRRNTAMVRAAAAGRDDPQDYSEPSDAQFSQLNDAIAATGLNPDIQAVIGSVPEMQALPVTQQCELGVAFYKAISDLPDDVEPAMAAFMLSPE